MKLVRCRVSQVDKNLAPTVFLAFRERFYKLASAAMGQVGGEDASDFAMRLSAEEMYCASLWSSLLILPSDVLCCDFVYEYKVICLGIL